MSGNRRVWVLSALLLLLGGAEVWAYSFQRNPENGRVRQWLRTRFPLTVSLHKDGCPTIAKEELSSVVKLVLNTWSTVPCSAARLTGGEVARGNNAPTVDGANLIRFITSGQDWQWGANDILHEVITTRTRTGEITDVDLMFNSWKYSFGTQKKESDVDFQAALTHAVGRLLGLGYSEVRSAVLYPSLNVGSGAVVKRQLHEDDKKGLCDLYPKDSPCVEGNIVGGDSYCFNGRLSPICPQYSEVCKVCSRDTDCRGSRTFCLQNVDEGRCGMECDATGSCPEGFSCRKIMDSTGQTQIGANCAPSDSTCANVPALPCCRSNDDCFPGFSCDLLKCVKGTSTDPCNGQCTGGQQCVAGKCETQGCTNDAQCGVGWACRNSRCVQAGACGGGCLPGQVCSNNTCMPGVGSDCSNGGVCATGLTCATGAGYKFCSKACTSASDCDNGTFCVQGLYGSTLTTGCWPSSRANCSNGSCKPIKGGGCSGCNASDRPPVVEGFLLLILLLFQVIRKRLA